MTDDRCPTCTSPDPALHPAMAFEGEVEICRDDWHGEPTNRTRGNADPYVSTIADERKTNG